MNCPHCGKPIGIRKGLRENKLQYYLYIEENDWLLEDIEPEIVGNDYETDIEDDHEVCAQSTYGAVRCPHCLTRVEDSVVAILNEEAATKTA